MFQFAFSPLVPDSVVIIAVACLAASLVGLLIDLRREYRDRAAPGRDRPMTRPGPVVDEADEARAYEWLTSESAQYQPRPRPNSD